MKIVVISYCMYNNSLELRKSNDLKKQRADEGTEQGCNPLLVCIQNRVAANIDAT
jgi:hypothetical protein